MGSLCEIIQTILQIILIILIFLLIIKLFFGSNVYSNLMNHITKTKAENIKFDNSLSNARIEAFRNINRAIEESFTGSSSNSANNSDTINPDGQIMSYLNKTNRIKLELYYKPNCPHCKTFMPTWSKIINDLPADATYEEINCDSIQAKEKVSENKITSVPSLVLLVDNQKKFYMGSRTYDDIARFMKLNGVNLVKRTYEDFNTTYVNNSSYGGNSTGTNPNCPAVTFNKDIDITSDSYMYQIFNTNGQYGYATGGNNTDKLLTPFQAAYSTIDSYLSSLPDGADPNKSSYQNINECASLYANNIINFGLCDIDQLNAIQGYQSNVSSGISNPYIDGTDYSSNSIVVDAIKNACGFNS